MSCNVSHNLWETLLKLRCKLPISCLQGTGAAEFFAPAHLRVRGYTQALMVLSTNPKNWVRKLRIEGGDYFCRLGPPGGLKFALALGRALSRPGTGGREYLNLREMLSLNQVWLNLKFTRFRDRPRHFFRVKGFFNPENSLVDKKSAEVVR